MTGKLIFSGSPSQVINLPALLKGLAVLAALGAIDLVAVHYALFHWPVAWLQLLAVALGVALPFAKTARTEIVIDTECISWRQGILQPHTAVLALSHIRSLGIVHPWWQRPFGIGMIVVETDDTRRPVRHLPGIRQPEALRERLRAATLAQRAPKPETALTLGGAR